MKKEAKKNNLRSPRGFWINNKYSKGGRGLRIGREGQKACLVLRGGVLRGYQKVKGLKITNQCCNSITVILVLRDTSCNSVNAILILLVLRCLLHKNFIIKRN